MHALAEQPATEPARKLLVVSVGQSAAKQHAHEQSGAPHGGGGGGFMHGSTAAWYTAELLSPEGPETAASAGRASSSALSGHS